MRAAESKSENFEELELNLTNFKKPGQIRQIREEPAQNKILIGRFRMSVLNKSAHHKRICHNSQKLMKTITKTLKFLFL